MLRYTRHPLVDVGAATITAFADKARPQDVAREDLERVAGFIEESYTKNPMKSFLSSLFPNSGYVNPSIKPEKVAAFMKRYLYAFRDERGLTDMLCAYCGRQANVQVYRQHVPLLTGERTLNFFPTTPGLPICGLCLLCIQAFPLGAAKTSGRALIIHSDSEEITFHAAANFLKDNLNYLQLQDLTKYPDQKFPRTMFVDQVLKIVEQYLNVRWESPSVTLYHLTNYGTNPDISILHLPAQIMDFLRIANSAKFAGVWRKIVRRSWQQVEGARAGVAQNFLFEDLFELPERAGRFIRIYFLRQGYSASKRRKDDPRRTYALERELDLVSWELTAMFLREVVGMERERIDTIRRLGDRISAYVVASNDKKFFTNFYMSQGGYGSFRGLLIKASNAEIKRGRPPLVRFDEFITVFEDGEDLPRTDWRLARDLVLIRVIERLHEDGWMNANQDLVPEEAPEEMATEAEGG
jgi:CRISPR-associated protein Cst1